MKKILLLTLSVLSLSNFSFAEWALTFTVGTFFDNSGAMIKDDYKFALIVDMNKKGFGNDFILKQGDTFARGEFINSSNDYKTLVVGSLSSDEAEPDAYFAYQNSTFKFNNSDYNFSGGEAIGLVVWNTKNDVLNQNDMYTVLNPAYTDTSSSDDWLVSAEDRGNFKWELYNKTIEGDTSDSFFTLSKTVQAGGVIPEPSTYAVIFGAAALCFAACRKRK